MSAPRFRTLGHAADLRVAVWGRDEEELIRNAVSAAIEAALGRRPRLRAHRRARIRPWPAELAPRLVRAVNEALFHLYTRREVPVGLEETARGASLALAPLPAPWRPQIEIKAATYHDLRPRRGSGRLAVVLVLDV